MTAIKICGITTVEDALECAALGVDYIGLIFAESPRKIDIETAAKIVAAVEGRAKTVGVFKDQSGAEIFKAAAHTGIDLLQLHGSETPQFCSSLPLPVIKAVSLSDETALGLLTSYETLMLLVDRPKEFPQANWLPWAIQTLNGWKPMLGSFFFAGGLTESNIAQVIRELDPAAVDACSGIECAPGKKDLQKLKEFCAAVREVETNAVVG
jgi:phosphoribosylanthranilate isomerase